MADAGRKRRRGSSGCGWSPFRLSVVLARERFAAHATERCASAGVGSCTQIGVGVRVVATGIVPDDVKTLDRLVFLV